jgi:hypothetical protein
MESWFPIASDLREQGARIREVEAKVAVLLV